MIFTDIAVIKNEANFTNVRVWLMASNKINGDGFRQDPKGAIS